MKLIIVWFFTFILPAIAAPSIFTYPEDDEFYKPPPGFESALPGTVLKIRKTPHPVKSIFFPINIRNSWQILFKTETTHGNNSATVATLIEPFNANSSKVVTYNMAEDSADSLCAPSFGIQAPDWATILTQAELFLVSIILDQLCFCLIIDYEGPQASFLAGVNSGQNVLNGIRLAINSANQTGLDPNFETVLWGYSGGSLASIWAAAIQPAYAPELKPRILGAAAGGLVTNITTTLESIDGTLYSGLITSGIKGLSHEYPILNSIIDQEIGSERLQYFNYIASQCIVPAIAYSLYSEIFKGDNRWVSSGYEIFSNPDVKEVMDNNTLGIRKNEMPEIPIFVYHGMNDSVVPYVNTERIYDTWCTWGIESFEVSASETTRHITEFIEGLPAAVAWINARFNHAAPVKGCLKTIRYSNLLYPGALPEVISTVEAAGRVIFGLQIAPNSKRENIDYDKIVEKHLHDRYIKEKK